MSCKKIILQLTHLILKALFLILIFSSCSKEEIYKPKNPQIDPEPTPTEFGIPYHFLQKNKQETSSITELRNVQAVLSIEKQIRDLTLNTLYATYFYPQLRGLLGTPTAEIRTGCPCSTLSTSPSGIHTMELDYDACSTLSGSTYDGQITVVISGDLDVNCTTIDITLSDDFTVDVGDLDGSLSMKYEDNGVTNGYNITDLTLSNTTSSGDETTAEIGFGGNGGKIRVTPVGTNSGPLDLIDDNFTYEEAMLEVTCPGPIPLTLSVFINTTIFYNILCGVPQDGEVALSEVNDGSPYATIDFAHPNVLGSGVCNNEVAVYLDSDPTGMPNVLEIE